MQHIHCEDALTEPGFGHRPRSLSDVLVMTPEDAYEAALEDAYNALRYFPLSWELMLDLRLKK